MLNFNHRTALGLFIMLASSMCSQAALAHSEKEKSRFVAEQGEDQGQCNNRFRPCKSITYAVQQANKGDKILVAQGTYPIVNEQDLLYLVSDLQPVLGGFDTLDNYQVQQPDRFRSVLVGVPPEYVDELYNKGFTVITDRKGIDTDSVSLSLETIQQMSSAQFASPCENGSSAGFECMGISLLSHVPLSDLPTNSGAANDIWGHVDLNDMREYAIIGLLRGIAVVDVTDPTSPKVVGSVLGQPTTWRDIKVYQYYSSSDQRWKAYAYVGADSVTEGLTIIDLSNLPNSISLVTRTTEDQRAHNVYISNVDYTTNTVLPGRSALLHAAGTENFGGAWRSFSLSNPSSPLPSYQLTSGNRARDYSHDTSSLLIDDLRADRDCVDAQNGMCNVMLDFNEDELRLWDHTLSNDATELGSETYPNAQYVHSGWWSENKQYVILHDELDEQRSGINTTVHFFDISDLNSPTLVSSWVGPTRAIDHNGFVRGNRYYMSNYERGLTVLDISNPLSPQEVGYFDTFGASNNASFNGAWGVYPYLPSGTLLVSDIQGGLYVLRDDTLQASDNIVGFAEVHITGQENADLSLQIDKSGDGAMTVDYHVIYGSASNADVVISNGSISWANNDTESKFIPLSLINDRNQEPEELFFVRLANPSGGALNARNTAFVTIEGDGLQRGLVSFEQRTAEIKETDGSVTFNLIRSGGTDSEIVVNYTVSSGSASADLDIDQGNGTVSWADGDSEDKTITLNIINDNENEGDESFTLSLSATDDTIIAAESTLTLLLRDDEANQPPTADAGSDVNVNTRQTVTLAGTGGDPEDKPITISWTQTNGSSVTLNNADGFNPNFTAPSTEGTLTFELTTTDDFNVSTTDSVSVTVNATVTTTPTSEPSSSSSGGSLDYLLLTALWIIMRFKRAGKAPA